MDLGQIVFILGRLVLGGVAAFLAILLWARTRDIAWMLMIMGIIAAYGETIYSVIHLFDGDGGSFYAIGSMSIVSILLPCFPLLFFIAGFAVMVARKYRHR